MGNTIRKILEVLKPFRWQMAGVLGFIAVQQVLNLVAPYLYGTIIDTITISERRSFELAFSLVGLAFAVAIVQSLVQRYRELYEINRVDYDTADYIAEFTLGKVMGFSISQHLNKHSGVKRSTISRGEHSLHSMVFTILYNALPLVASVVVMIIALVLISWQMGLVLMGGCALYTVLTWKANKAIHARVKRNERLYIDHGKFQGEILENMPLVLASAQEERITQEHARVLKKAHRYSKVLWGAYVRFWVYRSFLLRATEYAILGLGVYYVFYGTAFTAGTIVIAWGWTRNAIGDLGRLGHLQRQLMSQYGSIDKLFDLLAIKPEVTSRETALRPEHLEGAIEFRDVTFRYASRNVDDEDSPEDSETGRVEDAALAGVSLVINPGEIVGVMGESGAGKSTLVQALIRAHDPESGQILVDGNDLCDLDLRWYRKHIGLVEQNVCLWDASLRYNILFSLNGDRKASDKEIQRVLAMTCLDEFVSKLEKGLETLIGERGIKLSGGERQRVGIARALIKNPSILIFDEATSSLDTENERRIQEEVMEKAAHGRTTIIIAHRLSTIANVDKVVVMDSGRVAGVGTHQKLSEWCDPYTRLVRHQVDVF